MPLQRSIAGLREMYRRFHRRTAGLSLAFLSPRVVAFSPRGAVPPLEAARKAVRNNAANEGAKKALDRGSPRQLATTGETQRSWPLLRRLELTDALAEQRRRYLFQFAA
ncbi:hypothetical protein MRX96_030772 [Rhipicephalus microplus]